MSVVELPPPVDSKYLLPRRRMLVVLTGAALSIFVASISHAMLIAAVPRIVSDLGGIDRYSWVFTGYFLASTVSAPLWGKTSDIYGRRIPLALALISFLVGAVICAVAPNMNVLIIGRAFQGLGSGGIVPVSMAVVADLMAPRERSKWIGYLSSGSLAASLAGPAIGGWVSDTIGWRWMFLIIVPVALASLAFAWFAVRLEPTRKEHELDVVGAALLGIGLSAGLLALSWGGTNGWSSTPVLAVIVASIATLCVFGWWEKRVREPIVPLTLFKNRTFAAAQLGLFCLGAAQWSGQTYVPLLAQGALGETAAAAGAVVTPLAITSILTGILAGQFVSRTGWYRPVLLVAPVCLFVGFLRLYRLDSGLTRQQIIGDLIMIGLGVGLASGVWNVVAQNSVGQSSLGVVAGANQFSRVIGGTITLSVLGAILTSRLHAELARQLPHSGVRPEELLRRPLPHDAAAAAPHIFAAAVPDVFLVPLVLAVLALGAALLIERRSLRTTLYEAAETTR